METLLRGEHLFVPHKCAHVHWICSDVQVTRDWNYVHHFADVDIHYHILNVEMLIIDMLRSLLVVAPNQTILMNCLCNI